MRWAEGYEYERPKPEKKLDKSQLQPEKPQPPRPMQSQAPPKVEPVVKVSEPEKNVIEEIPREPALPPKVQVQKSITPEPAPQGPVLLAPDTSYHKISDKQKSPNKFMKFFGGKSKEEKESKRASRAISPLPRAMSPLPPAPSPVPEEPKIKNPTPPAARTPPRAPSPAPVADTKEWEEEFDGTHRLDTTPMSPPKSEAWESKTEPETSETLLPKPPKIEEYRSPTPPAPVPTIQSETPTQERTPESEEMDRWAQIRKAAGQRTLNRMVAPPKATPDEIEVNIPRMRQTSASPKRGTKVPPKQEGEEEESVDARVARIRKRVQELTAGMNDD
jgi:hypothetical protein